MMTKQLTLAGYLPALLLLLFLSACEDQNLDPIEDTEGIYSFYGTAEVGKSPNYVRIRNLSEPFLADSEAFDGTVTFEDLETNEVTTLRDTVINFNGNITHNFIIEDEIELDRSYLLKAVRSDGLMSQSVATTPKLTDVNISPDENISCNTDINFVFGNVGEAERIDLEMSVLYAGQRETGSLSIFLGELERDPSADEVSILMSPLNILVEIFPPVLPDNPSFNPYFLFPTVGCDRIENREIEITYTHYGPEWEKGKPFRGSIDTESGDVDNGVGFFGAFSKGSFTIDFGSTLNEN